MPGPTDTGQGGFDVDGELHTMDVGQPGEPGSEGYGTRVKTVNVDASYVDASGRPKDISERTRLTLGKYLSDMTAGRRGASNSRNRYPVSPPEPGQAPKSLTDANGNPVGPGSRDESSKTSFAGDVNVRSDQYPIIQPLLRKGRATPPSPKAVDGHDLLRADVNDEGSIVGKYRSAVLSNNRFAAIRGKSSFEGSTGGSDGGFNPSMSQQRTLGTYDPNAPSLTVGRMASVGPILTMRAGKELGAASEGASPNEAGLQAAALLPGLSQAGISRVDQHVLLASDVLSTLTVDELDSSNVLSVGGQSWGQLNNTNDPFSGMDALGMTVLSTALLAGVEVVFDLLGVLLGTITPSTKRPTRDAQGRYSLGEYISGGKNARKSASGGLAGAVSAIGSMNLAGMLGIQPTNYPFKQAMLTGLNAFFGIQSSGSAISIDQLAGAVASSIDSPGFNVVIARTIIRSSLTIADQLKRIGGNVINAVSQVLSLIETIRDSKIVAAMNIFANLGDAILSDPSLYVDVDSVGGRRTSGIDEKPDTLGSAVGKSRLKGSLKLAWASNTAPMNALLPSSLLGSSLAIVGQKNMGQFNPFMGMSTDPYSRVNGVVTSVDVPRIDTETAMKFEDELESSYVPFYFHDVRTNEMVAFHAFLASLTDDYNATYDRSEGFGRVEPAKIYKGTERRINMSFYVVATSLPDFDEMWIKLNKLVTLVYPQYTRGVQLVAGDDYKFTQPFSQLVGATPLIRIRLGDLLRSNYSLFALGRLFGMGNSDFKVAGQSLQGASSIDQGTIDSMSKALKDLLTNPGGESYAPCAGLYPLFEEGPGSGMSVSIGVPGLGASNDGPKFAPQFNPATEWGGLFEVVVKKVHPTDPTKVIGTVRFSKRFKELKGRIQKDAEGRYNNDDNKKEKVIGGTYEFPITTLVPTDETLASAANNISNVIESNGDFVKAVAEFLSTNENGNAVAKSFRDVGGKGLAGVIETMSFDWYDKVTWEVEKDRVAPKMCKVTIGFSPVHDITPGIDHLGFNRAPVYPVGGMRQQR